MTDEIKKYSFKANTKLEIEVVQLEYLTTLKKQYLIIPHRTNFYHIFLLENCQPAHLVDFNIIKTNPFTLLFVGKDRVHQFDQLLNYDGQVLLFTDDFFCKTNIDATFLQSTILFHDLSDKPNVQLDKEKYQVFKFICNTIKEELLNPNDNLQQDILKNLLHNFLLLAEREKQKQGYNEIIKGIDHDYTLLYKDLLETNYKEIKSVSVYAKKLHVSEKRLGQATTKILGKMPKQLIDERILLEAKRLLVHGNQSIKEIGFQLGFDEPTNFIKYFRKHTDKTPVEFREKYLPI